MRGPEPPIPPVGARLADFRAVWESITQDQWVLNTVEKGFAIEFLDSPPPPSGVRLTPIPKKAPLRLALKEEVQSLINKEVVQVVPTSEEGQGFYSTFFLVPKKPEGFRPILNLKPFNTFVVRKGFTLDSIKTIVNSLRKGDFAVSIDLKDAYYHVPILPSHRKFLRFCYGGRHLQFRALPFGLSSSPRAFCKCLAPIIALFHSRGVRLMAYLDDWLLLNKDPQHLRAQLDTLIKQLEELGWIISYPKSNLSPSQQFSYIGVQFDTLLNVMAPTQARISNLVTMAAQLIACPRAPALRILEVLGHMASLIGILPMTRFYMRGLQLSLLRQWKPKRDHIHQWIQLDQVAVWDLQWWAQKRNLEVGGPIWVQDPQTAILTDASTSFGWGAHWEDKTIAGVWTPQEASLHINFLEMKTVLFALQAWARELHDSCVLIRSDNTTVVQYIIRQGGTRSPALCTLAREIWSVALQYRIQLRAAHIAGKENIIADDLSRGRGCPPSTEWSMCDRTLEWMFNILGRPLVDLFAHKTNHKLPVYFSYRKDKEACEMDALSVPWDGMWGYAFPPFNIILMVLEHVEKFNCQILLLAPRWERRPWFPLLLGLLYDYPVAIPHHPRLLKLPGTDRYHPDPEFLKLTIWPISGNGSKCREFLKQLRDSSWQPGEVVRRGSTVHNTESSAAGALRGVSIPLIRPSTTS